MYANRFAALLFCFLQVQRVPALVGVQLDRPSKHLVTATWMHARENLRCCSRAAFHRES